MAVSLLARAGLFALDADAIPAQDKRRQQVAMAVVEGRGYSDCSSYFPLCRAGDPTATVEPAPVLLYATWFGALGPTAGAYAIAATQAALGMATVALAFGLAWRLYASAAVAAGVALLYGLHPAVLRLELDFQAGALCAFFLALGVTSLLRALETETQAWWIATGVGFGLAALSRTAFLYFPIVVAIAVVVERKLNGASVRWGGLATMIASFALVLAPWAVRNYQALGAFVPGATLNGYNLYRSNHQLRDDDYLRFIGREEADAAIAALVDAHRDQFRGGENEVAMDDFYSHHGAEAVRAEPVRYVALSLWRLGPLLGDYGVRTMTKSRWLTFGFHAAVFVLAIAGAFRQRWWHRPPVMLLALLVGYYFSGHMLVHAQMRYVLPLLPYLYVLAAGALMRPAADTDGAVRSCA